MSIGYRTFNRTNQPVWVTIYTADRNIKEDWGHVDPSSSRDWNSGAYAPGMPYNVRGEWPSGAARFDVDRTLAVHSPTELVFMGGDEGVYWSPPIIRTRNVLNDASIWVTVYSYPGEATTYDAGAVDSGVSRDWTAEGWYSSGSWYTLQAEWEEGNPPQKKKVKTTFNFDRDCCGVIAWEFGYQGNEAAWYRV